VTQVRWSPGAVDMTGDCLQNTQIRVRSTVRTYAKAVEWFASAQLVRQAKRARWEEVVKQDV
jgi:hypothetical protein